MRNYIVPALLVLLPACKAEQAEVVDKAPVNADELQVRATWELNPPKKMVRAAVAPKQGFAASMGHILMLSEAGEIYSTNTGFGTFTKISDGPYSDIIGLDRGENPSEFLALSEDGKVSLFTEISDTGFSSQALNLATPAIQAFCQSLTVSSGTVEMLGDNNSSFTITANSEAVTAVKSGISCKDGINARSPQYYYLQKGTGLFQSGDNIFVESEFGANSLKVTAGFSIAGLDSSDWVFTTSAPMGNTFTGGLTLISDDQSNRITMISNDYLLKRLSGELVEP